MTTKKATKPKFGGKKREPSRKKLENGLTPRQNEFTKKYVQCGDPIEAVYHAYNPKNNESAKYFIRWLQDLPPVKTQLQYLLRETKAPTKISDTFLAAMDATSQFGGEDTGLPDHNVRLKAAEGAAKILDVYPNKNSGKTEQHNHLHVDLSSVHPAILKYMKDNRGDIPSETEYYRLIDEYSREE